MPSGRLSTKSLSLSWRSPLNVWRKLPSQPSQTEECGEARKTTVPECTLDDADCGRKASKAGVIRMCEAGGAVAICGVGRGGRERSGGRGGGSPGRAEAQACRTGFEDREGEGTFLRDGPGRKQKINLFIVMSKTGNANIFRQLLGKSNWESCIALPLSFKSEERKGYLGWVHVHLDRPAGDPEMTKSGEGSEQHGNNPHA